jgi:hypothetical protein
VCVMSRRPIILRTTYSYAWLGWVKHMKGTNSYYLWDPWKWNVFFFGVYHTMLGPIFGEVFLILFNNEREKRVESREWGTCRKQNDVETDHLG